MLVFNYTLNICPAVGIRVAPIRTSFQTLPPLLLPGFRFLVISSLVYILSPDVYRVPCIFLFFFFPPSFQSTLSPQGERPPFQITRRKLVYRSLGGLGPVVFLFLFFRRGNGGHGGVLWIVNAHLSSLSWNGVDNDRETGEEKEGKEGLKHRHPKIRHRKFYWKSSLRIMRRYLRRICHLLSITELINISDNIILLRND